MSRQRENTLSPTAELRDNDGLQHIHNPGGYPLDRLECERLLVTSLPLVEQLCRFFCRGSRMSAEDVDDFVSQVRLHLIEDDYGVLRRFEGRCSLATFLALTIQHQLFDHRARLWGRFRASHAARRLGAWAVRLESLLLRDGKSASEAAATLAREGHAITPAEAERLGATFPERKPRALEVEIDDVPPALMVASDNTEHVEASERARVSAAVSSAMSAALNDLPADDRTILRLYFDAGMSVADIARSMGLDHRPLYRRIPRICTLLRDRLLAAGVSAAEAADLPGKPDGELEFGLREVRMPRTETSTEGGENP